MGVLSACPTCSTGSGQVAATADGGAAGEQEHGAGPQHPQRDGAADEGRARLGEGGGAEAAGGVRRQRRQCGGDPGGRHVEFDLAAGGARADAARSDAAREIAEAKADADAAREDLKDVKASFHDTLQVVLAADGPSSSSAPATSREGASTGWGSVNAEGEGRKQFFFGDPSDYDLSDINGPRSQVCCTVLCA